MRRICVSLSLLVICTASVTARQQRSGNTPSPVSTQLLGVKLGDAALQSNLEQRIGDLSQQISREMSENQKRTIAVVEFVDLRGNVTDLGRFLAEELITRLYQTKKFKVIERQLLNKVITEQKLSLTGLIEQASARQLGKLLGVDAIASGTVTDLGKSLRVNARLINTGTGEIFAVASTEIVKDESVMNLVGTGVMPPTSDASAKSSKPSATKEAPQKVTVNDFTLELNSCKMAGQTVTCNFTVINISSEDKPFRLVENVSRMFDNLGNEYHGPGSQKLRIHNGSLEFDTLGLVPQVPTRAALKFESVSLEATRINLLRVTFETTSGRRGASPSLLHADFRDAPIVR